MIITGARIRNLTTRFGAVRPNTPVVIGLTDLARFDNKLDNLGFSNPRQSGETILPHQTFGPVSQYNAEGRDIVHRDQPMETAHRQSVWRWFEFHGRYDRVEQQRIVDVPYQRYPRTFDPPPSIELSLAVDTHGNDIIVTPQIIYEPQNHNKILHTVNLLLEIFGECNVLDRDLNQVIRAPIRRLNWDVLPQGQLPWTQLRQSLSGLLDRQPPNNQQIISHRLETLNNRVPDFVAVGRSGFEGYVIFAFPSRNLFIMECIHTGNATYVFGQDWQTLSQMTKAEILQNNLQRARIVHRENWDREIARLFT